MNHSSLELSIAVYIPCLLVKHDSQQLSNQTSTKLTCLNPVQPHRVTTVLSQYRFIKTSRGKNGGYSVNCSTASIRSSVLYHIFVLEKDSQQRIFTGHEQSDCEVPRNITKTVSHYNQKEHRAILNFYNTPTINDIINDTLQEDITYDIL